MKVEPLAHRRRKRPWRVKEQAKLIEQYGTLSNDELAKLLNRTPQAIRCAADRLGLKKEDDR